MMRREYLGCAEPYSKQVPENNLPREREMSGYAERIRTRLGEIVTPTREVYLSIGLLLGTFVGELAGILAGYFNDSTLVYLTAGGLTSSFAGFAHSASRHFI